MQFLRTYTLFQPSTGDNHELSNHTVDKDFKTNIFNEDPLSLLIELPIFRRWVNTKPKSSPTEIMLQVATGSERAVFPAFSAGHKTASNSYWNSVS
jgi:hypothetical protein